MKTKFFYMIFSIVLLTGTYGCWTVSQDGNYKQSNNSQTNYSEYNPNDLDAYGEWIVLPDYGRVWRPSVNTQWQPFADGHWVYDGNDWVWDSYEPYGAIVYHYGYWEYVSNHRWIWIPNRAGWSPACVVWTYYGNEVAWAPRPRPGHDFGNPWDDQPHQGWIVVHNENFYDNHVNNHRITDVSRDKGRYRDDQITRNQPSVKYVRDHTNTSIPVTQGISRNGTLRPNRPVENTPTPAHNNPAPATGTTVGRPSATTNQTPTPQTPSAQPPAIHTPSTQTPATQQPATQPPSTPAPGRGNVTPDRNEPGRTNTGTTTTTGTKHPVVGGQSLEPTPVKPQSGKSTVKTIRSSNKSTRSTTPSKGQQQPARESQNVKKAVQVKTRQQPDEGRQDTKVKSRP